MILGTQCGLMVNWVVNDCLTFIYAVKRKHEEKIPF